MQTRSPAACYLSNFLWLSAAVEYFTLLGASEGGALKGFRCKTQFPSRTRTFDSMGNVEFGCVCISLYLRFERQVCRWKLREKFKPDDSWSMHFLCGCAIKPMTSKEKLDFSWYFFNIWLLRILKRQMTKDFLQFNSLNINLIILCLKL